MSNDLNKHQCIGRLGKDPEVRYNQSGAAITTVSIACGSSWKDKNTGEKQERTEWIRYVAFGKLAEIMGEYLRKGSQIYIEGELRTRKWQNQEGVDQYTTEIVASNMQMLGGQSSNDQAPPTQQGRYTQQPAQRPAAPANQPQGAHQSSQAAPPPMDSFDDDIPF